MMPPREEFWMTKMPARLFLMPRSSASGGGSFCSRSIS